MSEDRAKRRKMTVRFERDYETELIRAVIEDLSKVYKTLEDGTGYHLGDEIVDYIAEREGDVIRIADALWAKPLYVHEFVAGRRRRERIACARIPDQV